MILSLCYKSWLKDWTSLRLSSPASTFLFTLHWIFYINVKSWTSLSFLSFSLLCITPSDIAWFYPDSIIFSLSHWIFYYIRSYVLLVSTKWCFFYCNSLCRWHHAVFSVMPYQVLFMTIFHCTYMVPAMSIPILYLRSWSPPCSAACD